MSMIFFSSNVIFVSPMDSINALPCSICTPDKSMPVKVVSGQYSACGMILPPHDEPSSNTRAPLSGAGESPYNRPRACSELILVLGNAFDTQITVLYDSFKSFSVSCTSLFIFPMRNLPYIMIYMCLVQHRVDFVIYNYEKKFIINTNYSR